MINTTTRRGGIDINRKTSRYFVNTIRIAGRKSPVFRRISVEFRIILQNLRRIELRVDRDTQELHPILQLRMFRNLRLHIAESFRHPRTKFRNRAARKNKGDRNRRSAKLTGFKFVSVLDKQLKTRHKIANFETRDPRADSPTPPLSPSRTSSHLVRIDFHDIVDIRRALVNENPEP